MSKQYRRCIPQKGLDGRFWIDPSDPCGEVDVYHIAYEIDRGHAISIKKVGTAPRAEDIPEGALVCFGSGDPTLWAIDVKENR